LNLLINNLKTTLIMKTLNKSIAKGLLGMLFLSTAISVSAQDAPASAAPKASFTASADLVSSYVWRGIAQETSSKGGSPNIQPTVAFNYGGLTIGAWGSGSFSGATKEVDLYATYAFNDIFSLTVTDYNWTFTSGKSYFKYDNDSTDHLFEATLAYAGVKSFPLSIAVNTIFAGADKKVSSSGETKNAFSTYVELAYPLAENAKLFLGASLLDSPNLYTFGKEKGFSVINIGVKATKNIKVTDSFTLPLYGIVGANPEAENVYFVAGVTF
jgi:hypothetical protein